MDRRPEPGRSRGRMAQVSVLLGLVDRAGALRLARSRRVLRQLAQGSGGQDLVDQVDLADQVLLHRRVHVTVGLAHVRGLAREVLRVDLRDEGGTV